MFAALVGLAVGLGVSVFGACAGLQREKGFYPVVLIVVASYYLLFAAIGDPKAFVFEAPLMAMFVVVAVAGLKVEPWLLVGGLLAHAGLDLGHGLAPVNGGMPAWWPAFCGMADVALAGWLAFTFILRPQPPRPA